MGELIKTFVSEGGDTGFMSVLNIDPSQQRSTDALTTDYNEIMNTSTEPSDRNVEQAVAESIQKNVQSNPEGVQAALMNGMGILLYLEVRLQSDSGNINYAGFKADETSNAYVDFITKRGSMEAAAMIACTLSPKKRCGIVDEVLSKEHQYAVCIQQPWDRHI